MDLATIYVTSLSVTGLLALLLAWSFRRNPAVSALGWWAAANLAAMVGFVLMMGRGKLPDWLTIEVANSAFIGGYGLAMVAARRFNERSPGWWVVVLAVSIWLTACQSDTFYSNTHNRVLLGSILLAGLSGLTAHSFLVLGEPLASKYPLAGAILFHSLFLVGRALLTLADNGATDMSVVSNFGFMVIAFEGSVYAIASAFLLLSLAKERAELHLQILAETDGLTGLLNRRAFMAKAEAAWTAGDRLRTPPAIAMFDLDRFKAINDQFGHHVGDVVLKIFADVLRTASHNALIGRLGGEEFAMLVAGGPHSPEEWATAISRRFSSAARIVDGCSVNATVSIGIASASGNAGLEAALRRADHALYTSKAAGRDQVRVA